jgi:acyl-CoA synthetase (NDP forming)
VAIAGASPESRWARRLFANLQQAGYPGRIYLVNPKYREVWERPCLPSVSDLPEAPDIVYVLVPAEQNLALLESAARVGTKAAVIFAAGYAEQGDETGHARQAALARLVAETGMRVVGPNCFGCVSARERVWAYPQTISVRPGHLAIVGQSGGAVGTLLRGTGDRAVGVSYAISSGNEVDLDLADYLHFLAAEEQTRVIALFLEGIRDPERFLAAAGECLHAQKPILAVKVGRTARSREGALSHTGALTGSNAAFESVCERYGIVRCVDLNELLETAIGFLPTRWSTEPAVAGLTISGGQMSILPDLADAAGVPLARLGAETVGSLETLLPPSAIANPLDSSSVGFTNQESYTRIAETLLADPGVGCLVMQGDQFLSGDAPVKPEIWARLGAQAKPVLLFSRGYYSLSDREREFQQGAGLPFIQGLQSALTVARKLSRYARTRERLARRAPQPPNRAPDLTTGPSNAPIGIVGLGELAEILDRAGIPTAPFVLASSANDLFRGSKRVKFPAVLKLESPDAPHKSAAGLLRLGICSEEELRDAADDMGARAAARGLNVRGYLLQRMLFGGVECILGATHDRQFGLVLMVGSGGINVERWARVTHRLAPIDHEDVYDMLSDVGLASADQDWPAFTALATRFAELATDLLSEPGDSMDMNPVLVGPPGSGATVLDARAVRNRDDRSNHTPRV